jgi:hypothetical protein
VLRPAWVFAILLVSALLAFKAPEVAAALKRLFEYVPGIGLVEPRSECASGATGLDDA